MNHATFHRFFRETAPALKAYLRLRCSDATLADDLLQETYLRVLRQRLPDLGAAQLKSYLYKTAHSVCADYYRARRHEVLAEPADDTDSADSGAWFGNEPAADSVELPVDMQRVFGTLKPRQQSLLWLAYVEGFNHDEIATVIGVSAGSVKVLLSRARAELAARLVDVGLGPTRLAGYG